MGRYHSGWVWYAEFTFAVYDVLCRVRYPLHDPSVYFHKEGHFDVERRK
jgi:hypothetical protein